MATVSLSFSPLPAHVRTARLLAVAMGRRASLPEPWLDEVRLAVGEACTRAISVHARIGSSDLVRLTVADDEHSYLVTVADAGDLADVVSVDLDDPLLLADPDALDLPAGLELAVVAGLVDDLTVEGQPTGGTLVTLRWKR